MSEPCAKKNPIQWARCNGDSIEAAVTALEAEVDALTESVAALVVITDDFESRIAALETP